MTTKKNNLKAKRVLITSGPTWIPIDKVRVLSNTASGRIGIYLSREATKKGAQVTLLLGPSRFTVSNPAIRVLSFRYFSEFRKLLERELKKKKYDVVIHAAAVADYKPITRIKGKLKSGIGIFSLILEPTVKIINKIKKIAPGAFLVAFKLELDVSKNTLLKRASRVLERSRASLIVANIFSPRQYRAYIVNSEAKVLGTASSKAELSKKLLRIIAQQL